MDRSTKTCSPAFDWEHSNPDVPLATHVRCVIAEAERMSSRGHEPEGA